MRAAGVGRAGAGGGGVGTVGQGEPHHLTSLAPRQRMTQPLRALACGVT